MYTYNQMLKSIFQFFIAHKFVISVFFVLFVFLSFIFVVVYKKTSSKNNTSSVIISENKDLDNDGIPDWLEQIVGTSEKNRHIQPNEIALREEKRFLGAVIASEIEKQGGAITSLGEKELAQIVSDSILRELKNTFPAIKISILPSDILDKNVFSQQFLYALSPFLDPDTQFQSTLLDAISENATSLSSLARLETACTHAINNLPNEVPPNIIEVYSNFVNRFFSLCVPLLQYSNKKSSNTLLQIISAIEGDLREGAEGSINPQSISWLSYYLTAILDNLEK